MELRWPSADQLHAYVAALEAGWSPDNLRGRAVASEQIEAIRHDPAAFLDSLVDREARGAPIALPDGTTVPRLPGYQKWLWDGDFCGVIGLRWSPGTTSLPSSCPGHIGFSVVPWKRRLGLATRALALLLPEARGEGLDFVELTTEPSNEGSRRVIEANGGVRIDAITGRTQPYGEPPLRYRIFLR